MYLIFYIKSKLLTGLEMITLICLLIIILIKNNSLVFSGATTGLMLWFNSIIPLLLPFMLLSKLLVANINQKKPSKQGAIFLTVLAGLLCGYPIGAYTIKNCLENRLYSKRTASLLLPLCSSASPMFISGFVLEKSLLGAVSLTTALTILYLPYLFYIIIISYHVSNSRKQAENEHINLSIKQCDNQTNQPSKTNGKASCDISELVCNINTIGVYIIICSVAAELLLAASTKIFSMGYITLDQNLCINILLSSIEITRGIKLICSLDFFSFKKITALVLALTSFGGISSILQTRQVIQNSGLSIKKYIAVKLICGCASYFISMMII